MFCSSDNIRTEDDGKRLSWTGTSLGAVIRFAWLFLPQSHFLSFPSVPFSFMFSNRISLFRYLRFAQYAAGYQKLGQIILLVEIRQGRFTDTFCWTLPSPPAIIPGILDVLLSSSTRIIFWNLFGRGFLYFLDWKKVIPRATPLGTSSATPPDANIAAILQPSAAAVTAIIFTSPTWFSINLKSKRIGFTALETVFMRIVWTWLIGGRNYGWVFFSCYLTHHFRGGFSRCSRRFFCDGKWILVCLIVSLCIYAACKMSSWEMSGEVSSVCQWGSGDPLTFWCLAWIVPTVAVGCLWFLVVEWFAE